MPTTSVFVSSYKLLSKLFDLMMLVPFCVFLALSILSSVGWLIWMLQQENRKRTKELVELEHLFGCVVDHATQGRLSKTNYAKEVYYNAIDDVLNRERDEAAKEAIENS